MHLLLDQSKRNAHCESFTKWYVLICACMPDGLIDDVQCRCSVGRRKTRRYMAIYVVASASKGRRALIGQNDQV